MRGGELVGNSILEIMQGIEEEAKQVLADFDKQIQELRAGSEQSLADIATDYDKKTQLKVTALEEESAEKIYLLKSNLADTIAKNDSSVRLALSHKKDDLAQQIVGKVVEKYGN